jgi:hypothetical protein
MTGSGGTELREAEASLKKLASIVPPSKVWFRRAIYTAALIMREAGVSQEKAEEAILRWAERAKERGIKAGIKPSNARREVKSAYKRVQDKPSKQWYKLLTGEDPPSGDFWVDIPPGPQLVEGLKRSIEKSKKKRK